MLTMLFMLLLSGMKLSGETAGVLTLYIRVVFIVIDIFLSMAVYSRIKYGVVKKGG